MKNLLQQLLFGDMCGLLCVGFKMKRGVILRVYQGEFLKAGFSLKMLCWGFVFFFNKSSMHTLYLISNTRFRIIFFSVIRFPHFIAFRPQYL